MAEAVTGVVTFKVLIVEDREEVWHRIRETFMRFGDSIVILAATTVREARELLRANPDVAVVALDYNVPEDKGGDANTSTTLVLADEIKETFKGDIIAMGSFPPDREEQMRHGCSIDCREKGSLWQEVGRVTHLIHDPPRAA